MKGTYRHNKRVFSPILWKYMTCENVLLFHKCIHTHEWIHTVTAHLKSSLISHTHTLPLTVNFPLPYLCFTHVHAHARTRTCIERLTNQSILQKTHKHSKPRGDPGPPHHGPCHSFLVPRPCATPMSRLPGNGGCINMRGREGAGDASRPWSENKHETASV